MPYKITEFYYFDLRFSGKRTGLPRGLGTQDISVDNLGEKVILFI